jgi:hypothetical protein
MTYLLDGVADRIEFAIAPLNGYVAGPVTVAMFFKLSTLATGDYGPLVTDSGFSQYRLAMAVQGDKTVRLERDGVGSGNVSILVDSTSKWYLAAVTWTGATSAPRVHLHDGTAWAHGNAPSNLSSDYTILGTDRLVFGSMYASGAFSGSVVCAGIKKTNSADLQVETLSRTSFQTWKAFGFDWLVGFDSSLVSGGLLQDQASPGTGDQVAITGTSVVADPPGWSFAGGGTTTAFEATLVTQYPNAGSRLRGLQAGATYRLRSAYLDGILDPAAHVFAKNNPGQVKALTDAGNLATFDAINAP